MEAVSRAGSSKVKRHEEFDMISSGAEQACLSAVRDHNNPFRTPPRNLRHRFAPHGASQHSPLPVTLFAQPPPRQLKDFWQPQVEEAFGFSKVKPSPSKPRL